MENGFIYTCIYINKMNKQKTKTNQNKKQKQIHKKQQQQNSHIDNALELLYYKPITVLQPFTTVIYNL